MPSRGWFVSHGEEAALPNVWRIALPEGAGGGIGRRAVSQTARDERLFREAWFQDFQARWRRDLYAQRITFAARMAAVTEENQ